VELLSWFGLPIKGGAVVAAQLYRLQLLKKGIAMVVAVIHHYPNLDVLLWSITKVTATTAPASDDGAVGAVTMMINSDTLAHLYIGCNYPSWWC
jgi:uncharacterized membrane protein